MLGFDHLTVDGTLEGSDMLGGDGTEAPFFVFDSGKQQNVAGPFDTRADAENKREELLPRYSCDIYKPADGTDCTLRGESSFYKRAQIFRQRPADATADKLHLQGFAVLILAPPRLAGAPVRAVPMRKGWSMFGGNFAWSCDSTFRQDVSEQPIAIHDRFE